MRCPMGATIRSTLDPHIQGEVCGYGAICWPSDPDTYRAGIQNGDDMMHMVYLVKVAEHSMHGRQACVVMRADRVEEVK